MTCFQNHFIFVKHALALGIGFLNQLFLSDNGLCAAGILLQEIRADDVRKIHSQKRFHKVLF